MASDANALSTGALVVDSDPGVCRMICGLCEEIGLSVWSATDGQTAMEIQRRHWPALVFIARHLPDADGLALMRQMLATRPATAVVVLAEADAESSGTEALRAGAWEHLTKPLRAEELKRIIDTRMQSQRASHRLTAEEIAAGAQRIHLRLPNSIAAVPPVAQALERLCPEHLAPEERGAVRLMVHEALLNAVEHGNLGITLKEKTQALKGDRYEVLLAERASEPERAHRQVAVDAIVTDSEFRCTVTDMGEGFDWRSQPDPREPRHLLRENGRGLLLIRLNADEVIHSEAGNQITMLKRFKPPA